VRSGLLSTCGCVVALPLRDVGARWASRAVCPAFRADDACPGAIHSSERLWAGVGACRGAAG